MKGSNSNSEDLAKKYPSLQLAYEHVKDVLIEQQNISRALNVKAATLLAAATAVIGIGIPLVFTRLTTQICLYVLIPLLLLAIIPIYMYFKSVYLANRALRLRQFRNMNNPLKIRKEFSRLPKDRFYYDMVYHIGEAFEQNKQNLERKTQDIADLQHMVIRLTISIIVWSIIVLAVSLVFS